MPLPLLAIPFPAYYATNYFQPRLGTLLLWMVLVFTILFVLQISSNRINKNFKYEFKIYSFTLLVSGIFLLKMTFLDNSNFKIVAYDLLKQSANKYDDELTKRYLFIHDGEKNLPELKNISPSLFFGDITKDRNN